MIMTVYTLKDEIVFLKNEGGITTFRRVICDYRMQMVEPAKTRLPEHKRH